MSIKDRLREKSGDLSAKAPQQPESSAATGNTSPRTGPGQMLAFRSQTIEQRSKVQELEDKLKQFDDSIPARKIDASMIQPSHWANRHESSFADVDFMSLKESIREAGVNTQPIKIRPVDGSNGRYEIVFGHRRHRACLELGLPVLALIDSEISVHRQFREMDQENRERKNLSPWEQGMWYKRALTEGLWPSQNAMAKDLGASQGNISSALIVADLPDDVVSAFPSPNQITFKWARQIHVRLKAEHGEVIGRAKKLLEVKGRTAEQVFAALVGRVHKSGGVLGGDVSMSRKGVALSIECSNAALSARDEAKLKALIEDFLKAHRKKSPPAKQ